jgi:hypothetical protein
MKQSVKLKQLTRKLSNCCKLESSFFKALGAIPVGHVKLKCKLGQLAQTPANATVFLSPQFVISLPHINVCVNPFWEFTAHMCRGLEGCTALTQQEDL